MTMTQEEIRTILSAHNAWLHDEQGGKRADLSGVDLSWANLSGAYLCRADMSGADLCGADLRGAIWNMDYTSEKTDIDQFIFARGLGSRKDETQWDFKNDLLLCGCFTGSLEKFAAQIEETHRNNPIFLAEYRAMIRFFKDVKKAREEGMK
jgi:uncharacterized protein YjbI with pentapeptide repeats